MGQAVYLETDHDERCPLTFRSGGEEFSAFLADLAPEYKTKRELMLFIEAARPLRVDFGPLALWANEDDPDPEAFEDEALARVARRLGLTPQAYFEREQQRNDRAWQSPQALLNAARSLLRVIREGETEIKAAFLERFSYKDLSDDLDDLCQMAEWASQKGTRVRIVLS